MCDVGELGRAVKGSGGGPASWLLEANNSLEVITRGTSAVNDINALLSGSEPGTGREYPLDAIEFLPAVIPRKILAIGRNYVDHAIEGGTEPPKAPLILNKLSNSLSAHNAPIVLPKISSQVDYEAELAVVIGRKTTRVFESQALECVFGYTLINDVRAR